MYGTSLIDAFLLAGTRAMAEKSASGGKDGGAKWPTFPGDNPTLVALDVYLRHFNEELQSIEAAYVIAGKTPPSLIGLAGAVDTSALVKIAEPTTRAEIDADTVKAKIDRTKFNSYCDERIRAEKAREERFDAGIADIKSQLATIICNTMRDSAPVLLRALKKETQMGTSGTMFDGVAMYNSTRSSRSRRSRGRRRIRRRSGTRGSIWRWIRRRCTTTAAPRIT